MAGPGCWPKKSPFFSSHSVIDFNRNFHFEPHLHLKTYASYPIVSSVNRSGLFEVVVRLRLPSAPGHGGVDPNQGGYSAHPVNRLAG